MIFYRRRREINSQSVNILPKAITTVLCDFPFTSGVDKESIRKAVSCKEDMLFVTPDLDEQLKLAVTLALLNTRFANTSSIIVVRTSNEARKIYNILNSHHQINSNDYEKNEIISPLKDKYAIRVASTFSKFKGNSHPSANDCIIITSYDYLFRNLLYRKSTQTELKNRITLPLANAYIFVDPFDENKSLRKALESFTTLDIEGIIFFKRKSINTNIRMHYISPGFVPLNEQKNMLKVTSTIKVTGDLENDFSYSLDKYTIREKLRDVLPYLLLLSLYSGQPTKRKLVQRIKNSINYSLLHFTSKGLIEKNELEEILFEELYRSTNKSMSLFETLQQNRTNFALVSKVRDDAGIFTLTPLGKKFLIASTYFKEIKEDPLGVLKSIKNRVENGLLNWESISEIFHNFTNGKIAYDDLQVLLGRLQTKKNDEDESITKILTRIKDDYSVFKVCRLLTCFQDHMLLDAKTNFNLISKALGQNPDSIDETLIGKKDRLAIEQAIIEELEYATDPLTKAQIVLNLSLQKKDVELALINLEKNHSLPLKTITVKPPKGRSVTYYSMMEIPEHFFKKCGNCYCYHKNGCNFWLNVKKVADRKVPEDKKDYISTTILRKNTVGCEAYLEAETMEISFSIAEFNRVVPKRFDGYSSYGEEEFTHFCPFCSERKELIPIKVLGNAAFPQQGSKPTRCPRCNASIKLVQERIN